MLHRTTPTRSFWTAHNSTLGRLGLLLLLCAVLVWLSGCSVLVATPRTTRVQVSGLNNHVSEYVIVSDEPDTSELDIKLTDRYAIRLDFQWLWSDRFSSGEKLLYVGEDETAPPAAPWFTCLYRF